MSTRPIITDADENVTPGERYDVENAFPGSYKRFATEPTFDLGPPDQWGASISGTAPIYENGKVIATFNLDIIIYR